MIQYYLQLLKEHCWGPGGLLALCFFTHAWGFCPNVPYVVIWAILAYCLDKGIQYGNLNFMGLIFMLLLPLGTLFFGPDPCFQSWLRYASFVLLFLAIGPVFFNPVSNEIRRQALNTAILLIIFTGIASFFCFFLGINFMRSVSGADLSRQQAGYFGGLCHHSMTLGPLGALGSTALFYLYMKNRKWVYMAMLACCLGSVLFAASRAALAAAVCGILVVTWFFSEERTKMVKRLVLIGVVATLTFPLWEGATSMIMSKQTNNKQMGSMTASRDDKFTCRIMEFKESPFYGVGFCAIDPKTRDEYNRFTGQIEPGSSWLLVPSMTGLAGTIPFLFLLFTTWVNSAKCSRYTQRGLLLGLFTVFLLHFTAEGYLFSAGNEMCFLAWLVIACCAMPWEDHVTEDGKFVILDE